MLTSLSLLNNGQISSPARGSSGQDPTWFLETQVLFLTMNSNATCSMRELYPIEYEIQYVSDISGFNPIDTDIAD